jgi:hypothetical protein
MKKIFYLFLAALLLSGCTTFTIHNNTDKDYRVAFASPDSSGLRVSLLHPKSVRTILSLVGGHFSIGVLDDRVYLDQLTQVKNNLVVGLSKPNLTPDEVTAIVSDMYKLKQSIAAALDLTKNDNSVCGGTVIDNGTVDASVIVDSTTGSLSIICTVKTP